MTMWSTDEMKLSLQSRTHFVDLIVDLIFKKWSEAIILWRFFCETGLLLQSRAHSVDRIFKTWSEPLSFVRSLCDMELLLTFCRPHSGVNSRAPDRSQDDWHDDVVDMMVRQLAMMIDMMMWLTWWLRWWCGCHDGETASHWQSSVQLGSFLTKLPLINLIGYPFSTMTNHEQPSPELCQILQDPLSFRPQKNWSRGLKTKNVVGIHGIVVKTYQYIYIYIYIYII